MTPVGFEPTITAGERPQTYALDRAATGTGKRRHLGYQNIGCQFQNISILHHRIAKIPNLIQQDHVAQL